MMFFVRIVECSSNINSSDSYLIGGNPRSAVNAVPSAPGGLSVRTPLTPSQGTDSTVDRTRRCGAQHALL